MKRYVASLAILILVYIGQATAVQNTFIFRYAAFHLVMHIAAGIGIALFISALISSLLPALRRKRTAIVVGTLVVGAIWEAFEAHYNITGFRVGTAAYYWDTAKDLLDDGIGAVLAVLILRRAHSLKHRHSNHHRQSHA